MSERFTVLVVCTGNICRSPIGERLLRHALDSRVPTQAHLFRVRSAGTYAGHRGEPMQPAALAVLGERSVPAGGFRATALSASMIEEADLVLTAERSHRQACERLAPSALRRTFTVKEFARLVAPTVEAPSVLLDSAGADSTEVARALVALAASIRASEPVALARALDDIDDPYAQPLAAFRRTADEIDDALAGWVGVVATAASV